VAFACSGFPAPVVGNWDEHGDQSPRSLIASGQLLAVPVTMPAGDPLVIRDEAVAPPQRVAILRIARQDIGAKGCRTLWSA
jgi:hypothetical protein